ncbi:MAG: hypothetical protein Q8861_05075 [Bacteroidota bacterium]|nr:hypothetical protein [Bacteroidota bacterium]
MNLLIVENEKESIQFYEDRIEIFNGNNDTQIVPKIVRDVTQAEMELKTPAFDAAIIDLKLTPGTPELDGVKVIDGILHDLRIPVFVVSGSIAQYDQEETPLFKKKDRDGNFDDVLNEIVDIYDTGITKILGSKGLIDTYLNSIFWTHLSDSMDIWIKDKTRTSEVKQKILSRLILSHIQEYLELNDQSGFDYYHPAEIYITPVIKPKLFTGDIVAEKSSNKQYIVLTPSCDLAQGKAKDILLAEIESPENCLIFSHMNIINNKENEPSKIEESEDILKKVLKNAYSNKYHYLPNYKNIKGGLINFQKIQSIRVKGFEANFERISSVNQSFIKDIVARFSYYYSRQGSPDISIDEMYSTLFS